MEGNNAAVTDCELLGVGEASMQPQLIDTTLREFKDNRSILVSSSIRRTT